MVIFVASRGIIWGQGNRTGNAMKRSADRGVGSRGRRQIVLMITIALALVVITYRLGGAFIAIAAALICGALVINWRLPLLSAPAFTRSFGRGRSIGRKKPYE